MSITRFSQDMDYSMEPDLVGEWVRWEDVEDLETKYQELLTAVSQKYEGETRHQTALRYIREREETVVVPSKEGGN